MALFHAISWGGEVEFEITSKFQKIMAPYTIHQFQNIP